MPRRTLPRMKLAASGGSVTSSTPAPRLSSQSTWRMFASALATSSAMISSSPSAASSGIAA